MLCHCYILNIKKGMGLHLAHPIHDNPERDQTTTLGIWCIQNDDVHISSCWKLFNLCFFMLCFQLPSNMWLPTKEQFAFDNQGTWGARCWVSKDNKCCFSICTIQGAKKQIFQDSLWSSWSHCALAWRPFLLALLHLPTKSPSPTEKFTSSRLSDSTFFALCHFQVCNNTTQNTSST